jgi:hypothetical protein
VLPRWGSKGLGHFDADFTTPAVNLRAQAPLALSPGIVVRLLVDISVANRYSYCPFRSSNRALQMVHAVRIWPRFGV